MRQFSFAIGRSARLMLPTADMPPPPAPAAPPAHELRRRLEDAVEDVFHAALTRGDLATAEDLLGVLEGIDARARIRFHSERKGTSLMIDRVRNELAARKSKQRPGRI